MKQKINLVDIRVQDVGATCITLVSKFSRVIKAKHGVTIQLRDKQVLSKVAAYAEASNSPELKLINSEIQHVIRQHLLQKGISSNEEVIFSHQPLVTKKKSMTYEQLVRDRL